MPITIDQLVELYPTVYHMAERDALPQIRTLGLLSTTAALDLFEVDPDERRRLEIEVRPTSNVIEHIEFGKIVLRDQKPLSTTKLAGCLQDGLSVEDWLTLINRKVFFWVAYEKVENLLGAREYKDREHIVIAVDTRSLVTTHEENVTLAPMNTGTTNPFAHPRGTSTIAPLADFPFADRRRRGLNIGVELCVDYSVPDLFDHVQEIYVGSADGGLQPPDC